MVAIAIKRMLNDKDVWQKYYSDFISQYLHMSATPDKIEYKLLRLTFDYAISSYNEIKAIAAHCYLHLYQLDLAKVVALLKPMGWLKPVSVEDSVFPEDPEKALIHTVQESQSVQEISMTKFVVDSLFAALSNVIYHRGEKMQPIQEWHNSYRGLVSIDVDIFNAIQNELYLNSIINNIPFLNKPHARIYLRN